MCPPWQVDDSAVEDDVVLYRIIGRHPDDLVTDAESGALTLGLSAFPYKGDGMSVYLSTLLAVNQAKVDEIADLEREGLAQFAVGVLRRQDQGQPYDKVGNRYGTVSPGESLESPGGIVITLGTHKDPRLARSHGVVRIALRPPAKAVWNVFRNKLLNAALFKTSAAGEWVPAR